MIDYTPERGPLPDSVDLAHGMIQVSYKKLTNTPGGAIARRLTLHGHPTSSCYDHELLLTRSAPDLLKNLATLVELYNEQRLPDPTDLVGITT